MPMTSGLVSVTFRKLDVPTIADLVARAGLDAIEWGGDVHVKPADADAIATARRSCADAGVQILSYGSYLRLGACDADAIQKTVDTAAALGASQLRVWPGNVGSADADAAWRERVTDDFRTVATLGAAAGIKVAVEFHGHSLTDTPASTLDLMDAVAHPNAYTYWQPNPALPDDTLLAGLDLVRDRVLTLHVFAWTADHKHLALSTWAPFWRQAMARFKGAADAPAALLEFVRDESPEALMEDAAMLRQLLKDDEATA